jgi:Domain of unknown function (DUF222)/HNH endonuclease
LHDHEELIEEADAAHRDASHAQRRLFALILEIDLTGAWRDSGARDLAHWVGMRYGISYWKASRWIAAAHALEELPLMSEAFSSGDLGADKVVELTRFATPETESRLITWAQGVSVGAIRHKGDLARASIQEAQEADRARRVEWWYFSENSRFGLSAELPAAQGAVVAKALERLADILPVMPGEEGDFGVEARRADALVALCSARIAADPDPDRGTAVIHARVDGTGAGVMEGQLSDCEIEGGPAIHPEVARRLLCTARVQTVLEDSSGHPVRLGRIRREPPEWMVRQLKYRDRECRFPGCASRRFTQAHHIRWWDRGGRTDLDNLVLICSFHHKLVHEYGWKVSRDQAGTVRWFYPDGTRYRAGPGPPEEPMVEGNRFPRPRAALTA